MKYDRKKLIDRKDEELSAKNYYSIVWNKYKLTIPRCNYLSIDLELIEIQSLSCQPDTLSSKKFVFSLLIE